MSTHTPGPWTAYAWVTASDDLDARETAYVVTTGRPTSSEEQAANARLIAAAPELHEVVRLLTLATNEGDDLAQGTHYVDARGAIRCKGSFLDLIEKARAAIAFRAR